MDELTNLDGTPVIVRHLRADDIALHREFIARLEPDDLRFRFGHRISEVPRSTLPSMTRVDQERETTFIATMRTATGNCNIVGEVRIQEDIDAPRAEFAIAVRSDLQRRPVSETTIDGVTADTRHDVSRSYGLSDCSECP